MPDVSPYERGQIDSLLQPQPGLSAGIEPGVGLFLCAANPDGDDLYRACVAPAFTASGVNLTPARRVFDSDSDLATLARWVCRAEVIVADVPAASGDLLYVLGLCHGLRRCPLLLVRQPLDLPFNLAALRHVEYTLDPPDGPARLRANLTRALRVFLTAARTPSG